MLPLRAILLLNSDGYITRWQAAAIREAEQAGLSISGVLFAASQNKRQVGIRNLGYYSLAASARLRNPWMKTEFAAHVLAASVPMLEVECEVDGAWDVLPPRALKFCAGNDVVIKFGLGLLRIPNELPVPYGILSYHHGDPRRYRGRPAGFHEMANDESLMGIMVQRLSNHLDAGEILAEANSPVYLHSYRRTLTDAYRSGIPLLAMAIRSLSVGRVIDVESPGTNYSLPGNPEVARVVFNQFVASAARLVHGAFRHKAWQVGHLKSQIDFTHGDVVISSADIKRWPAPKPYVFLADPCGEDSRGVFCEAMLANGKGSIAQLSRDGIRKVDFGQPGAHFSYPQIVRIDSSSYLFPEVASHRSPCLYEIDAETLVVSDHWQLKGLEDERILDGTLLEHLGRWYLFGQRADEPVSIVRLWHSDEILEGWVEHPSSPIAIDPRRARMAGPILAQTGVQYRLAQDSSEGYGSALTINRIESISSETYVEVPLGRLSIDGFKGPHTLAASSSGGYWLDLYRDRWSALAGVLRLRGRIPGARGRIAVSRER